MEAMAARPTKGAPPPGEHSRGCRWAGAHDPLGAAAGSLAAQLRRRVALGALGAWMWPGQWPGGAYGHGDRSGGHGPWGRRGSRRVLPAPRRVRLPA